MAKNWYPVVDIVSCVDCGICVNFYLWREDWGLDDPSGQPDEVFLNTIRLIEGKIIQLKEKLR